MCATSFANAETRILKFYNLHTKERVEVPYKNNGRYIKSGLKKINYILRDWRHNETVEINPRLLDLIWTVYQQTGSNDYINVICGYRNSETNSMLRKRSSGVAKKSQHTLGNALDFYLPDVKLSKLRAVGLKLQEGGVGYYPRSGSPFVHIDVGNVRHWPRMSRRELVSLFPDGKTMHVPTDGKPLPGYNQALAAYKARQNAPIQVAGGSGKGGGLLAAIFGGGADEEEDNAQSAAPARATASTARPDEPVAPATVLASISSDALPVPRAAPRTPIAPQPEVAVGQTLPQAAPVPPAALESAEAGTQGAEDAPATTRTAALDMPTPTWRPAYTPAAESGAATEDGATAEETASALVAMAANAPEPEGADAIAEILEREDEAGTTPVMTAALMTLPTARPSAQTASLDYEVMPQPASASMVVDARRSDETEEFDTQLGVPTRRAKPVAETPRLALMNRRDETDPVSIVTGRVRTTGKASKPTARDSRPESQPVVVPVKAAGTSHRVLNASRMRTDWENTRLPDFDARMMRAPETVYMAGFRPEGRSEDDQRFTGKAVTFLAVARFATN